MLRFKRAAVAVLALVAVAPAAHADRVLTPNTRLWVDPESSTALVGSDDAERLAAIPNATWLTGGGARADAANAVRSANRKGEVPVLVAYNIPDRDCGEYSSGGARNTTAYKRWIDGLAAGIKNGRVAVILEPDAVAGDCGGSERTRQLKYAIDRLRTLRRTAVYLDAGHSAWHDARTIAKRLVANGISRADGFALNVSNYRTNAELIAYGEVVSKLTQGRHFVIDTSRNGQGPWTPPARTYPDPQDWCNPPGRGLGERPTTIDTGSKRLDAKLWVKTPGESDGECTRGLPGPQDPEWGVVDPGAGAWFPQQAAELIRLANPPLG